ncbi:LacI family transcriptional regulator [bacterium]|nr:MAG: LacI family transcriptional regulator [bacterium]
MDGGGAYRRPTITDVARRARVSAATVSYVLNDRPGVGEASRRRVLAAAEVLGYRRNRLARGLRDGRSHVLGLLLANIANPFYPEIAAGVIAVAADSGYQVFVSHTGEDQAQQRREVEALSDHGCDGLIFTSVIEADRELLRHLMQAGPPFVQAVRRVRGIRADYVGIDNRAAGRDVILHLAAMGHTDIALIAGPPASSASRGRYEGMREALKESGLALPAGRFTESALTREAGYQAATSLLQSRKRPTAIACGNDMIALGAIDAAIEAGVRMPAEMAVTGFDDMSFASSRMVNLTTISQPLREIGATAVELLRGRLRDPSRPPQEVILPHQLIVRGSSSTSPAGARPAVRRQRRG